MSKRSLIIPVAAVALALGGCATSGHGYGETRRGGEHVDFAWTSSGAHEGTMTATLADGIAYSGPYFQITRDSTVEHLTPLWYGWRGAWRGWPYWGPEPGLAFVTHYTGKVVANLVGPNDTHMRCHFRLKHPSSEMAGGGVGKCQFADGETIDAQFPAA